MKIINILHNENIEVKSSESSLLLEELLTIERLLENLMKHIDLHRVTPRLDESTKWRDRATLLCAGLELAVLDILDFNPRPLPSDLFSQTLENIEKQVNEFNEKITSFQGSGKLFGLTELKIKFEASSAMVKDLIRDLEEI